MKKILSLILVLIAIGQVNANVIEPHSPVGMSVIKNGSLVKLFYQGEQTGKVKVKIYNERGRTVFSETMKDTENFVRPYNFSFLPAGEYTIELTDAQGKMLKKVNHARETKKRMAYLTRLDGNNKYMLSVVNDGRESLTVRIYDAYNKLVYNKTQTVHDDFAAVYNLSHLTGDYEFEVVDRNGNTVRLKK